MIKAIVTGHSGGLGAALAADLLSRGIVVLGLARRTHAPPARPTRMPSSSTPSTCPMQTR
jgi:nucleoside-diphosphate-sugar epimerase